MVLPFEPIAAAASDISMPRLLGALAAVLIAARVPRGEVGLIFAQMGLATAALDEGLFSAVILMVMVTTFIAPPWLGALARQKP